MTCQYLAAVVLITTIAGFTTYIHDDTVCPVRNDQMPCLMTVMSLYANIGENVILNCTCSGTNNGQWLGPNRTFVNTAGEHFMPYTQGLQLNPKLNKSKFRVVGDIANTICNLEILNFLSDDEGIYKCQYVDSVDAVNIHKYNVLTAGPEYDSKTSTEKEITYTVHYGNQATRYFEHLEPSGLNIVSIQWMMPLIIILIILGVAAVILLKGRKGNSDLPSSNIEDRRTEYGHSDTLSRMFGQSVENNLYQSADLHESRRHSSVDQHESVLPSQMQRPERRRANETAIETGYNKNQGIRRIPKVVRNQFSEISMNYAEVMFDNRPSTHHIIRGIDDKTIYSKIDHLSRAEPLPSSSSESEDDTIFVPKVGKHSPRV